MKKHNGIISFWKFVFCMVIIIFHAGEYFIGKQDILFKYGSIAVEFFFVVSGFLMCKSACAKKRKEKESIGEETFHYIYSKFVNLFPYIFIAFVVDFLLRIIADISSVKYYINSIFDLFMLKMAGFKTTGFIGHTWYISAMLISMTLIYPQIKKFNKNYFYFIAPISIILIGGWLNHNFGNLREPTLWIGFTYKGVVRAYIEIMIGSLLYPLSLKLKDLKLTNFAKYLLSIIEWGGYIFVIVVSQFLNSTSIDYILLCIISISTLIAFSEQTVELKLLSNKFVFFLEKLSLTMYLIHIPFRTYFKITNSDITYKHELIFLVSVSLVLGTMMVYIVDYLKQKKYFIPKLKKIFIQNS